MANARWLLLPLPCVGGVSCYLFSCLPAIPAELCGAYSCEGLEESKLIPLHSLHGMDGSPFAGSVPPNDMVNSHNVVAVKPGHSGMVIRYQVNDLTQTWLAEYFIA